MLNIKTLAVQETGELHLRDANGELLYDAAGQAVTVTLCSPGTKQYAKANAARQNRIVDRLRRRGKADQTAEEKAAEDAEYLASLTVSFNNFRYDEKLHGFEEFKAAYADRTIGFVADQVAEYVGEWGNFSRGSAKS